MKSGMANGSEILGARNEWRLAFNAHVKVLTPLQAEQNPLALLDNYGLTVLGIWEKRKFRSLMSESRQRVWLLVGLKGEEGPERPMAEETLSKTRICRNHNRSNDRKNSCVLSPSLSELLPRFRFPCRASVN
jgi:hypothetical protein